jgi:hypothetical protein
VLAAKEYAFLPLALSQTITSSCAAAAIRRLLGLKAKL